LSQLFLLKHNSNKNNLKKIVKDTPNINSELSCSKGEAELLLLNLRHSLEILVGKYVGGS
jgi:hypothetical protein